MRRLGTGRILVVALALAAAPGFASAACDQPMLQRLLDQGFSKDEIMRLCGGEPAAPAAAAALPARPGPVQAPAAPALAAPQAAGAAAPQGAAGAQPGALGGAQALQGGGLPQKMVDPHPAEIIGMWYGGPPGQSFRWSFSQEGRYRLVYPMGNGMMGAQNGTWSVDGTKMTMTPTDPPGVAETHAYQVDQQGLSLQSNVYGLIELRRQPQ